MGTNTVRSFLPYFVLFSIAIGVLSPAYTGEKVAPPQIPQPPPTPAPAPAQPPGADAAGLAILDTGRHAYNEGKFDVAAERFREFLKLNAQKKEAPAANYGLALSLLELPQKDYAAVIVALQPILGQTDSPDHPFALYYLASCKRNLGLIALEQAVAKPAEAATLRKNAMDQFADAAKSFSAAADVFAGLGKAKPAAEAFSDREWMSRCRCDQGDMLLRLEKNKEVLEIAQKLIDDKDVVKSSFRGLALYQVGCASFALKDYMSAGRALSQLAPFDHVFGNHARFLLSRTHHIAGEYPEAIAGYKALLADYELQKKMAGESMKNAAALKSDDRARFETLLKPPPDYIARATFYSAQLAAEAGEFTEAMTGFSAFVTQFPTHPLIDEAKLRLGFCFVQARNFPEAVKILQPLQAHAQLGDRAMGWFARSQVGAADPANLAAFDPVAKGAIDILSKAAEKAKAFGPSDSEAKDRRGDLLLELGDTQQVARMYKEAAATYDKVCVEFGNSERAEMALERQVTALHLAGLYKESDELCHKFEQTYPKSMLLAAVLFRGADNASLSAIAAANDPKANENRAAWEKRFDEAIDRYKRLIAKYPEFSYVNLARYGLATAQYKRGLPADAHASAYAILEAERNGDLAPVNYLLGDCLIRLFPPDTDDALQAAQLIDKAEQATRLLEKYAGSQGKTPQAADAYLKLAHCHQRIGSIVVDPAERGKILALSRQIYEKIINELGNTPAMPYAVLERARCVALQGDIGGAINEYNRFNADPLKQHPAAPMALIRMSTLMRTQNRQAEAVNLMVECRKRYEEALKKDPLRSDWIPQIQYEHGLALKDSGKIADARAIFEAIVKQFEKSPDAASAMWRAGQCRREELQTALAAGYVAQKKPGAKPEELTAANKAVTDSLAGLKQTAELLKTEASRLAPIATGARANEAHVRMLYEAAWCYRALADTEIDAARQAIAGKTVSAVLEKMKKAAPPNSPLPALAGPIVDLSEIPAQPSEKAAQDQYAALLAVAAPGGLSGRARLELAELQAQRGQNDSALELLVTALEDAPPLDLSERLKLRIASCLIAKEEGKLALVQTQAVIKNPASGVMGEAVFLTGEAYAQSKDWPNAIAQFAAFRDKDPFRNMGVTTEHALQRLSFCLVQTQKWDESRQALEMLVQKFPQSTFVPEAFFGIGTAWQNANNLDNAYNSFAEVTKRSASEMAARAQLQMGKCRLAQKKYPEALKELLAVTTNYDYRDVSAEALCEAGQVYQEQKLPVDATKMWQRVVVDYADTKWVETAKKRLAGNK